MSTLCLAGDHNMKRNKNMQNHELNSLLDSTTQFFG